MKMELSTIDEVTKLFPHFTIAPLLKVSSVKLSKCKQGCEFFATYKNIKIWGTWFSNSGSIKLYDNDNILIQDILTLANVDLPGIVKYQEFVKISEVYINFNVNSSYKKKIEISQLKHKHDLLLTVRYEKVKVKMFAKLETLTFEEFLSHNTFSNIQVKYIVNLS